MEEQILENQNTIIFALQMIYGGVVAVGIVISRAINDWDNKPNKKPLVNVFLSELLILQLLSVCLFSLLFPFLGHGLNGLQSLIIGEGE